MRGLDMEDAQEREGAGAGAAGVGGGEDDFTVAEGAAAGCDAAFLMTLTVMVHETPKVATI